jgi:hypothetical protein
LKAPADRSFLTKWHRGWRVFWRAQVKPWWRGQRWFVIGALWLLALALGYAGFARHFAALGQAQPPTSLLYLSVQLFVLNSGAVEGAVPWQLDLARFLAPAVATYTALAALAVLFYEQLQLFRVRFSRDHIVICGLGRKGLLLAKGFCERGDRVVVIELEPDNPLIEPCREVGAIVLIGNAASRDLLQQARVHRARYLLALLGDDGTNAEIALRARELACDRRDRPLTSIVHIVDPQLCDLLREREFETGQGDGFRLEFLNVFASGARTLLREHPPFEPTAACRPHLLVVGLGQMGESLVVHAAQSWWAEPATGGERLRLTIVDREAEQKAESLCLRYPQLSQACELIARSMDVHSPEFQRAEFLHGAGGQCDATIAYVCLDDDSLGLSAALALRQRVREQGIPIVVRMAHQAGLATLLAGLDGPGGSFENLHAFGLLDRTCTPDLVLGGTHEMLARAIHEEYVRRRAAAGETPATNASLVPWDDLPPSLQESNRRQADHIGLKLHSVGCGLAPLTDWDADRFQFSSAQIEVMARMEHERWLEERLREGYQQGPRDLVQETNPNLVPWDQVSDEMREMTRTMVRSIPALLARVGLQVRQLSQDPPATPGGAPTHET